MGYGLDGNDLVVGLVARGCPEAIGCQAARDLRLILSTHNTVH